MPKICIRGMKGNLYINPDKRKMIYLQFTSGKPFTTITIATTTTPTTTMQVTGAFAL